MWDCLYRQTNPADGCSSPSNRLLRGRIALSLFVPLGTSMIGKTPLDTRSNGSENHVDVRRRTKERLLRGGVVSVTLAPISRPGGIHKLFRHLGYLLGGTVIKRQSKVVGDGVPEIFKRTFGNHNNMSFGFIGVDKRGVVINPHGKSPTHTHYKYVEEGSGSVQPELIAFVFYHLA